MNIHVKRLKWKLKASRISRFVIFAFVINGQRKDIEVEMKSRLHISCFLALKLNGGLRLLFFAYSQKSEEKEDNSCRDGRYRPSGAAASAQSPRPRFALAQRDRHRPAHRSGVWRNIARSTLPKNTAAIASELLMHHSGSKESCSSHLTSGSKSQILTGLPAESISCFELIFWSQI